jgi:flavin-dependent dehydrogenase
MIVVQKAIESGAVFAHGEVKQMAVEPNGLVSLTIQGYGRPLLARIGIVATGVDVRLMHKMNWPARKKPSGVALRCYVRSSLVLDRLIISFEMSDRFIVYGYGWIFPMRDREYNVGFGILTTRPLPKPDINLKNNFKSFIDSFSLARELMQQSDRMTELRAAALRFDFDGAYPFVNGPIVAVGESIGTTLPFLGEGIGKAMESGQLAAEVISKALDADDLSMLSQYSQQIESTFRKHYKGYRIAEKWLARPRLNDFILGRFGSSKYAQETLAGVIAETKSPQEIFSLKGILKAFFK